MLIIIFYVAKHTLEDEDDVLLIDSDFQFSDEETNDNSKNNIDNRIFIIETHKEKEVSIFNKI